MGRIIFYEDRNFQGRSYETSRDCPELAAHLSHCSSCRVDSGCFMGHQTLVRRGEYPDNQHLMGHCGPYRMKIYEKENFGGQMYEITGDCLSFLDRYHLCDIQSCHVMDGHWIMYEQPHYRGRMVYLRPGEYRSFGDMGMSSKIHFGSIKCIMDSC